MPESFLSPGIQPPDFYVAAMGRSGSTILCNWLARPPEQLVFIEPFFMRAQNPRLLRIQLADFGLAVGDSEWSFPDPNPQQRFRRLMAPRLEGRSWAFKEVLCEEHFRAVDSFAPKRVLITVRDIVDVALSFFEKHRLQRNLDRFSDDWVKDYCLREARGLLRFRDVLNSRGIPFLVVRYEDFTMSDQRREEVAGFVGWTPGGQAGSHLAKFDRLFELERHGSDISANARARHERELDAETHVAAREIGVESADYQAAFGYR